jgi:hypothetical protein
MSVFSNFIAHSSPQIQGAPSIIENRQSLSDDIDQHFVEWFSGDALDTIWSQTSQIGTPSFVMSDSIDGGFTISLNATETGHIDFNDIRHYMDNASVIIAVSKKTAGSTSDFTQIGLAESGFNVSANNSIRMENNAGQTFYELRTRDTALNTVATTINQDTNWHTNMARLYSTHVTYHIDGDLEAISTSNLPAPTGDKLQPFFRASRATTNFDAHLRYMEIFNTG